MPNRLILKITKRIFILDTKTVKKMKAALVVLTIWLIKVQARCPLSCNCTETIVSCVSSSLEEIPDLSLLETLPGVLDFSGNHFYFISEENFDFPACDDVIEVYLNHSELADIGEGTFDNLESLQTLHLGENFISSGGVPSNIIENLNSMMMLDLSKNQLDGPMPIIKSKSLRVLGLVGSKISSIPDNALDFLPNLDILLLDQNNLQNLSFEPFEIYESGFTVKLTYNPWICSCENLQAFYQLSAYKFIDPSDPYQCTDSDNSIKQIFIDDFSDKCPGLIDPSTNLPSVNDNSDSEMQVRTLINEPENPDIDPENFEPRLPENCWQTIATAFNNSGWFKEVALITLISYVAGFLSGVTCYRVLYIFRYKKLEQTSDSQVQLLKA